MCREWREQLDDLRQEVRLSLDESVMALERCLKAHGAGTSHNSEADLPHDTPLPQARRGSWFVEAVHSDGQSYVFARRDGRPFQSCESAEGAVDQLEAEDRSLNWRGRRRPLYFVKPFYHPVLEGLTPLSRKGELSHGSCPGAISF